MRLIRNNNGFTLIEIIVVLIILGVLAAIALPSLFANIMKSKAATPLATMHTLRGSVDACIAKDPTLVSCQSMTFPTDAGWQYDFLDANGVSHAPGLSDAATDPHNYTIFAHPTTTATGLQSALHGFSFIDEAYAAEIDPSNYPMAHAEPLATSGGGGHNFGDSAAHPFVAFTENGPCGSAKYGEIDCSQL